MTSELGPTARSLLDAARAGLSPDAAAIRRVRAGLDATLGATAATTATTTTTATASAATKLGILKLSLLVSAVALVGIGVGTALYVSRTPDSNHQPTRPATVQPRTPDTGQTPRPAGQPDTNTNTNTNTNTKPARTPDTGQPRPPDTGQPRTPDTGQAARPAGQPDTRPARTPDSGHTTRPTGPARASDAAGQKRVELAREVELVDLAMASLRAHDYEAALAAARQHARETGGRGQLAEDAAAIEIEAMCHLHQSVFTKLEAFDARWPSSAQRSRLTNSCR